MSQGFLPLVLVSQIQRSGGSMMAQLLDGHPQLLVHPFEIHIGSPQKWDWPSFTLQESPPDWFAFLYEKKLEWFVANGYAKQGGNKFAANEIFPFGFSLQKLRSRFLAHCAEKKPIRTQRQILDAYFQAFFEAWENHQPTGRERYVGGFTPRVAMYEPCVNRFFADYPDGKLISLVRDPCSWYASTVRHNSGHGNARLAIGEWLTCMQRIAGLADRRNVLVLIYEDVLRAPEASMRRVADFIGIDFDPVLLTPTFLSQPVRPNSSFDVETYGINPEMIDRRNSLPAELTRAIEAAALPTYRQLVSRHGLASVAA